MTSIPSPTNILIVSCLLLRKSDAFDESEVKRQIISYYNLLRDIHNSPALIVDEALNYSASEWARHLSTQTNDEQCLYHSRHGGENIYFAWSTRGLTEEVFTRQAIRAFYEENIYYNYSNPGLNLPAAHFTNMVWRNCEKIGIGVYHMNYTSAHGACRIKASKRRPAIGYVLVVHQWPPSNVITQFEDNVLPPRRRYTFA